MCQSCEETRVSPSVVAATIVVLVGGAAAVAGRKKLAKRFNWIDAGMVRIAYANLQVTKKKRR